MARPGAAWQGKAGKTKLKEVDMDTTKKYPAWKNAVEIILTRFDKEGYGVMFSDNEINEMLEINKPGYGSYDAFQKFQLERLSQLESLKIALLEDANLCLENSRGNGYMLMHPDDQINKTAKKFHKHARNKINRMVSVLTNVDNESLSIDCKRQQLDMLGKAAFIRAAMNKRKLIE